MDLLWLLLIGLIAGWLADKIMPGPGHGILVTIVIGIIGSFIGGFLFRAIGITAYGTIGTIVMAVVGAIVFIALLRLIKRS